MRVFGGDWTQEKLDMVREYLEAYLIALRRQPFKLMYIDAFAGSGWREARRVGSAASLLFPELREDEPKRFLDGSPRIALQLTKPFDEYVFIEKSRSAFKALGKLKDEFPDLADRIRLLHGDCNEHLQRLCRETNWQSRRAVVFLDPFATQVAWPTLEAMAATQAMDTWILWPVMAMNRLLKHSGEVPESWWRCLERLLGTPEWYSRFYRVGKRTDLFGQQVEQIEKVADFGALKAFLNERLSSIFADVAGNPRLLRNPHGTPLFLLCFAAANPRGAPIAKRIAEHILQE
jgi:three-Cys-motif partner protein